MILPLSRAASLHLLTPFVLGAVLFGPPAAIGGDWPQILGPSRSGVADGEMLNDSWPADGPNILWRHSVGRGFAGPAVAKNLVVLFHRIGNEEIVEALDAASGKPAWKQSFPAHYSSTIIQGEDGPLCVPLIYGDRVLAYGAGGDLYALRLADGRPLWSRALYREFRKRSGLIDYGYFGAGSSPIVEGDRVLVNVGGFDEAGIVALELATGKTIWKATDELPSYSAPMAATVGGKRHMLFVTRLSCLSIDPATGQVRFRFPFGKRGPTVNGATPVVIGNELFVTASYGIGAKLLKFDAAGASEIWASDEVMSSQYPTSVYRDGYLYGIHGRADAPGASLRCVELKTGRLAWSQDDFGVASLILAGDRLLITKDDGAIALVEATPKAYRSLAEAKPFDGTVRALPALAGGRLYARDTATLKCFDVGR